MYRVEEIKDYLQVFPEFQMVIYKNSTCFVSIIRVKAGEDIF